MTPKLLHGQGADMHCSRFADSDLPERYLRGELKETDATAFEEHYFECESCFERLEELKALSDELERNRGAIEDDRRSQRVKVRWGVLAAVSTVFFGVALTLGILRIERASRENPLAELARVEAPEYKPIRLRDAETEGLRRFYGAMELYSKKDWKGAVRGLEAAVLEEPESAEIIFYLGATQLLAGETGGAIATLTKATNLGEGPFLEESLFYLGKAFLQAGNIQAARPNFERVVELEGPRSGEARAIIEKLKELKASKL